jgi:WD40 repeat protein
LQPYLRIRALAFSPDGNMLAAGGDDNKCRLWSVGTGLQQVSLTHEDAVTALAFSQDSAHLITYCADNSARAWEVDSKEMLNQLPPGALTSGFQISVRLQPGKEDDVDVTPEDMTSHLAKMDPDLLAELGLGSNRVLQELTARIAAASPEERQQGLKTALTTFTPALTAISPDGTLLAMVGTPFGTAVQLWETMTGQLRPPLEIDGRVKALAFSPDSRQLAVAVGFGTGAGGQLWDIPTRRRLARMVHKHEFHKRMSPVSAVAFSLDGRMLATGGDTTACLWGISPEGLGGIHFGGRRPRMVLSHDHEEVRAIAFSPDGSRLATVSGEVMRLWDVASKQQLTRQTHEAGVRGLAFSPDGRKLVTISGRTARLWAAAIAT